MHKLIIAMLLAIFSHAVFADTCPSVDDLNKGKIDGWNIYDSDDAKPLSAKRATAFKHDAEAFALAEWQRTDNQEGAIHCFYHDKAGSDMEAYVAKNHIQLSSSQKYWYEVSGSQQCAAGMSECAFKNNDLAASQLAKNE